MRARAADVDHDALIVFLARNGYARASTVREPGDFALRGGIIDLWPPGAEQPLRLDFFGPTLDAIRKFDAETQLVIGQDREVEFLPASETPLDQTFDQPVSRRLCGRVRSRRCRRPAL